MDNGGTVAAVAGADYAVIGADTRMSSGYMILSRRLRRMVQLTPSAALGTSGMQTDMGNLHKQLEARIQWYRHEHQSDPSLPALARLLSVILYSRRFFPFYTFNVLAGLDRDGVGAVYAYDAVGSYERYTCSATGSGEHLIQSVLDNQFDRKTHAPAPAPAPAPADGPGAHRSAPVATADDAVALLGDAFAAAAERDIHTGDSLELVVFRRGAATECRSIALRAD